MRITGEEGGRSPDIEKCAGRQAVSLLIVQNKDIFFSMYGNGNTTLLLHILEEREWK